MKIYPGIIENLNDEYIRRRNLYWKRLRAVRGDNPDMPIEKFIEYMKDTYGVKVILETNGITPDHEVLDEAKFMFLLLKYE